MVGSLAFDRAFSVFILQALAGAPYVLVVRWLVPFVCGFCLVVPLCALGSFACANAGILVFVISLVDPSWNALGRFLHNRKVSVETLRTGDCS